VLTSQDRAQQARVLNDVEGTAATHRRHTEWELNLAAMNLAALQCCHRDLHRVKCEEWSVFGYRSVRYALFEAQNVVPRQKILLKGFFSTEALMVSVNFAISSSCDVPIFRGRTLHHIDRPTQGARRIPRVRF
jgi:hypothetical protein